MIVEFRFRNFRSFAEEMFLQFDASAVFKQYPENVILRANNRLLKSLAVYGPNASGKSNIIGALYWFRRFILNSARQNSTDRIDVHPFALDKDFRDKPTLMEICILIDGMFYRYGFEVTEEAVVSEWLLWSKKMSRRDRILFTRENEEITFGNSYRGRKIQGRELPSNTLLLSRLDQMNIDVASRLMRWFKGVSVIGANPHGGHRRESLRMLDSLESKEAVLAFTRLADATIREITHSDEELDPQLMEIFKKHELTSPQRFAFIRSANVESGQVELFLGQDESAGTGKMFYLAGVWMNALKNGSVLVVDEIEARLHPLLTRVLVKMFNSAQMNPHGAQLLFVTHDVGLLANGNFRRDQIWFCEKDGQGHSSLYALSEIKERNLKHGGASVLRKYIEGKYGAIPFFEGWEKLQQFISGASRESVM